MKKNDFLVVGIGVYACSTLVSMAVMNIGFGFLLISLIASLYGDRKPNLRLIARDELGSSRTIRMFLVTTLALFIVIGFSLIGALTYPLSYGGEAPKVHLASDMLKTWYLFAPFFFAMLLLRINERQFTTVIKTWIGFAGIISFMGFLQFFTGLPRRQEIPEFKNHFHTSLFFGHHLSTASILIFPFFVALALAASKKGVEFLKIPRWLLGCIVLTIGTTLFLTWSRMLWLALPVGLLVWVYPWFEKAKSRNRWILITAGILVVSGLVSYPPVRDRMLNAMGTHERVDVWKANWAFFKARPILGIGWRKANDITQGYYKETDPGSWGVHFVSHAHNNALDMMSGTGLLGTLVWLCWNAWIFWIGFQIMKKRGIGSDLAWGILCAWVVFHLNGLTQVNFWEGKVLHQMMWATGILLAVYLRKPALR